jgi:hypothetical protein
MTNLNFKQSLLSTAYLPPIEYFSVLINSEQAIIEAHENYLKQSFRNRCNILSANGMLPLSIPVKAPNHTPIKEVIIDNSVSWQKQHWRSITSAYGSAPFFIYYDYELEPFYKKSYKFLFDFNIELLLKILKLIKVDITIDFTSHFDKSTTINNDFRNSVHPKKEPFLKTEPYYRVFDEQFKYNGHISIIDLIFNIGPQTSTCLLNNKKA